MAIKWLFINTKIILSIDEGDGIHNEKDELDSTKADNVLPAINFYKL